MGQQQLLLIALGTIVVGIAIVVGINLFNSHAVNSNRDELISDINAIAVDAQAFYKKPADSGGGGGSFLNWTMPSYFSKYESGKMKYNVKKKKDQIVITATGVYNGNDNKTKVKVRGTISPNDITIAIIN
jgi:uncharacterized protein YpmS